MSSINSRAKQPIAEVTMLLAVTPSILERLGLHLSDLGELCTARLFDAEGPGSHECKVVALSPDRPDAEDLNRKLLTADAMAGRMQCSRANVYDREKRGTIFSVLPPGRENGRLYPAFQLHPRLDTSTLHQLIAEFKSHGAPTGTLWNFLRSVREAFAGLTAIELLTEQQPIREGIDPGRLRKLLALEPVMRKEYVVEHALEVLQLATS